MTRFRRTDGIGVKLANLVLRATTSRAYRQALAAVIDTGLRVFDQAAGRPGQGLLFEVRDEDGGGDV